MIERIEEAAHERQPRRWSRGGGLALPLAVGISILAAASAAAALLLSSGETVAPAFVLPATPAAGLGEPIPQTLALLPIPSVADPEGGPPWGMRVIRTTRGLLCLQAGRVVDHQLGALGTGYAFHGDQRFHPFLADDAISTDACPAVGSSGKAFLPGPPVIVPANALPLAGENISPPDQLHCDLPGQQNWGVRCPQSELRQVAVGLLGPDARSIEVTNPDGSSFTIDPYGSEGAYLIVLPAQQNANASMSSGAYESPFGYVSHAPGGAVLKVTYDDGVQCQIPITSPGQQCHAQSTAGPGLPPASALKSAVQASYVPLDKHPESPLLMEKAGGNGSFAGRTESDGSDAPGPAVTVTFKAPVDASSAASAYVVELRPHPVAGCATPAVIVSQPTSQTLLAGTEVNITVPLETSCATSYAGRVFYASSSSVGGESGGGGPLYELIAAQFGPPGSGRNPLSLPTVGTFNISAP
ncbi:MAG TPA: hypothetical protein VHT27_08095 [Solirubrobacteraceae bacterium]|nr:hypothetical protein [Solirubrobacteraceae bacterium]